MELQPMLTSPIQDSRKKGKLSSSSLSAKEKFKRPATPIEDDGDDDDNGISAGEKMGSGLPPPSISVKKHKKLSEDCDGCDQSDYEKDELALEAERQNPINHRLWKEEDEIALLEGMVSFSRMKGYQNPVSCTAEFYFYIKNSFHFHVSRRQLSDKVCRLKKKFETYLKGPRTTLTERENKCLSLSRHIWGAIYQVEEDNPPLALGGGAGARAGGSGSGGDFVDGLCLRCVADLDELEDDVLEKMKKPVCQDEKLVRKWHEMRSTQISAAEKHADFLKTDARLLYQTLEREDDHSDSSS